MIASKKILNGQRVIQSRNTNDVLFSDQDMRIVVAINQADRENTGDLVVTFDKQIPFIVAQYYYGNNRYNFREYRNTKSFSKVTKVNSDDNGAGNGSNYETFSSNVYLSNPELVKSIMISSNGTGINSVGVSLSNSLSGVTTYGSSIPQPPDWLFLDSLPNVTNLVFQILTVTWTNTNSLKNSNLKTLIVNGYNISTVDLFGVIPDTLRYLRVTQMNSQVVELSNYFTGNRIGLSFSTNQSVRQVTYSGGAIFPSVLNDVDGFTVDYIFQIMNLTSGLLMTPTEVSRFLVDFANQVTACNLTNKRIRLAGHTANTSYTDASQPLFTTYASALNHITTTLGITVQFT